MMSSAAVAFTLFMFLYAAGRFFAGKTKGIIAEALFLCLVYAIGFITGIIPRDSLTNTGLPAMMSAFGTMLLVTNLGTMIELKRFIKEWKTVVVCLGGLAVMTLLFCTVGVMIYGREHALSAVSPVAGGIVAASLVNEAAQAAGKADLGAFASLLCSLQTFVGVPVSALLMKSYTNRVVAEKSYTRAEEAENAFSIKIFTNLPAIFMDKPIMVARLGLMLIAGILISKATGGMVPAAVAVLVTGIIGTEIGFLEKQTLSKAGYMDFLIMGLILTLINGFNNLTIESLTGMIVPIIFFLILGALGLALGGAIIGLILRVNWKVAASVALSAMFGYPMTEIIINNIVNSYSIPDEEKELLRNMVMPQMIIAGFTTVTVASVALAGFIVPYIFA